MLGYRPGMPIGFELGPTALSIVVAVAVTGIGLLIAVAARGAPGQCLGGAIVGLGIAAMHYTGMAALRVPALVGYDPMLVALSLLLAVACGTLALRVALPRADLRRRSLGALLLAGGICALHFTALAALELTPSPLVPLPPAVIVPAALLAPAIAVVTVLLLAVSLAGSILDKHLANRTAGEAARLQDLVDASFEGIAIHAAGRILDANAALAKVLGYSLPR